MTILAMRAPTLLRPALLMDDFQILAQSWTWKTTVDNLWVPANEHSMPLGRLSTWVVIHCVGRQSNIARLLCFQGPLAVAAAAVMVYLLVRRETGHPFPALLAMTLFGVSTHYWQAVNWFAASFAVLGLDMLLLGLLAAQQWQQRGSRLSLFLSAFWCALAPGWFGTGMLAGPLCTLYLLASDRSWRRLLALLPCLGTAVSLAITLPRNAERILNLPRVASHQKAWETFNSYTGLEYTLRAVVDDVIPGAIGFPEVTTPVTWVWLCLGMLAVAAVWWWRVARRRCLLMVGLGMIVSNYLLIFTARAYFPYEGMHHWSRYQLFPQLGLALIMSGGWPQKWYASLVAIPHWKAAVFLGVVLLTQSARPWYFLGDPSQLADFRRIEAVDARCRRFHIDAATAQRALSEKFEVSGCTKEQTIDGRAISGWDFLHGSDDPHPISAEEARPLLDLSREP